MTRIVFREIAVKGTRRWVDDNGKKRQQTRKFFQTLSPFNTTADGSLKTEAQICTEIWKERGEWLVAKPTPAAV